MRKLSVIICCYNERNTIADVIDRTQKVDLGPNWTREILVIDNFSTDGTREILQQIDNPEIKGKIGMIDFYSMTVRAFKLDSLEDICEDYGQAAIYLGTMAANPHDFMLDDHHICKTGKPLLVCGNTASMLQETRFGKFFNITGDRSTHFGPFLCSTNSNGVENSDSVDDNSCC